MHIVVCSKNAVTINAASAAFESHQPRLTVCESGLEVLAAVGILAADLLIVDLQTPGLNSSLIFSAIRQLAPSLSILAVSVKPEDDARSLSRKGISFVRVSPEVTDVQKLALELRQVGEIHGAGLCVST